MNDNKQKIPILNLNFKDIFEQLSEDEKTYAYYGYKACWAGAPIVLFHTSYESPALFVIFQNFFSSFVSFHDIKKQIFIKLKGSNVDDIDYQHFITYAAKFYSNMGNYSACGKRKFIPELPVEKFNQILATSNTFNEISYTWKCIKDIIYDDSEKGRTINIEEKGGISSYYLGGIKENYIDQIDKFLHMIKLNTLNTRGLMVSPKKFVVGVSSVLEKVEEYSMIIEDNSVDIIVYYGEFSALIKNINENLELAKKYCTNDIEKEMLDDYIEAFYTGNTDLHKKSQQKWVNNKTPSVEFNIGWIETYIDPLGKRGYYKGWVALTDKEKTKKYSNFVSNAEKGMKDLPWPKGFDNKCFTFNDFLAGDVVCCATNECPISCSLPNYDEVKENDGFKNILFTNASTGFKASTLLFCNDNDTEAILTYGKYSKTIITACHELLGHGSGILLRKLEDGSFNFNADELLNPGTDTLVCNGKYYTNKLSFEAKFTDIARSFDEGRADLIALFFVFNKTVHEIFEVNESTYKEIIYSSWLMYFRLAILGLPLYNPTNGKWGHARTQGAWVFYKFIISHQTKGEEIIKLDHDVSNNSFDIIINKEMILCYGSEGLSKILIQGHVWKCTGDSGAAREFYSLYSEVDDNHLKIRNIIVDTELPRRGEGNHNLVMDKDDKSISVTEYPEEIEGIIESFVERYGKEFNKIIYEQWTKYDTNFIK